MREKPLNTCIYNCWCVTEILYVALVRLSQRAFPQTKHQITNKTNWICITQYVRRQACLSSMVDKLICVVSFAQDVELFKKPFAGVQELTRLWEMGRLCLSTSTLPFCSSPMSSELSVIIIRNSVDVNLAKSSGSRGDDRIQCGPPMNVVINVIER